MTTERTIVYIERDDSAQNPCDGDGWKLYSFSRRHSNFKDPSDFDTDECDVLTQKFQSGLAFKLSYFEHSQSLWTLVDELPAGAQCPWDSVQFAGLLIWEGAETDIGAQTFEERQKDARAFLNVYTAWCNGEVYGYRAIKVRDCPTCGQEEVVDENMDSCWGFIGIEDLRDGIREALGDGPFELRGEAASELVL